MEHQANLKYDTPLLREALIGYWWRIVTGRMLVVLAFSITGLVYLWVNGEWSWLIGSLGAFIVFATGMIVAVYFVHASNMKRKLRDMGSPEATLTASESTFTVESGAGSSTVPWSTVTEVWKLKRCWLLLFSRAHFMTLPITGMSDEMCSFVLQRISEAGGKIND